MTETARRTTGKGPAEASAEKKRASKKKKRLTDTGVRRLNPTKDRQVLIWDTECQGLSLMVSPGGTKTFRSQYCLNGNWLTRTLGRFGELPDDGGEDGQLTIARAMCRKDRMLARQGIDPKQPEKPKEQVVSPLYETVVDEFIERYAKPRQRTWVQTERALKINCAAWLKKPIREITKQDAFALLDGLVSRGRGPTAAITLAWLRTLWKWAYKRDKVSGPIMEQVEVEYEKRTRDRHYSDDEIRAIWHAADELETAGREADDATNRLKLYQGAYVKLLLLLAPRKNELANMRRAHLDNPADPTLWTTPHELTKTKKKVTKERVYLTPLPPLAQRILKGLPAREDAPTLLFPGRKKGEALDPGTPMIRKLVKLGAPADFYYHAVRHTIATWLQKRGHSEFERGLVLNHSSTGVTAGYSHGYPLELKRELLTKWADHVERLVAAEGVALLR